MRPGNQSRNASPRGISPRSVASTGKSGLKGTSVRLQSGGAGRIPTGLGENLTPRGGMGTAVLSSPGISSATSPKPQMGRLTPRGDGGRLPMELVGGDPHEARSEEDLIRLEVRLLEDQLRAELAKKLREEKAGLADPQRNQEEAERKARQERERETRRAELEGRIQTLDEEQKAIAAKWQQVGPMSTPRKREDPATRQQSRDHKQTQKIKCGSHDTLHIAVTIVGAKDLPKSKAKGNPNSYCVGILSAAGSKETKTSVVEDSRKPVWNKSCGVLVIAPLEKLELNVWDKDFPEDEFLGGTKLSADELLAVVPSGDVYLYKEGKKLPGKVTLNLEIVSVDHAKHVRVTVIGAEDLPAADLGESSDPYLVCEVPGKPHFSFKTPVIKQTLAPKWNHSHDFPDMSSSDALAMTVWDQDPAGDELLGRVMLLSTQFMQKGFSGKVALQDCGVGVDDARLDLNIEVFEPGLATSSMKIRVVIVGADNLPVADDTGGSDPYCVCEVLGKKGQKFQTPVVPGTLAPRWGSTHEFIRFLSTDSLQFTIWDEDEAGDEMLGRALLSGSQIDPDGYEGSLVLQETGRSTQSTISVEVDVLQGLGTASRSLAPVTKSIGHAQSPKIEDTGDAGRVRVTIVAAHGLRQADEDGGSDPYCVCEVQGKKGYKFKTDVIEDSLNPLWNHSHEFSGISSEDVLMFVVWDEDEAGDDLLGRALLMPQQFLPAGFEGSVELEEADSDVQASLKLRVEVLEVPDQKSSGSRVAGTASKEKNLVPSRPATGLIHEKHVLEEGQMECIIVGAKGLRKAEFGHSDPYCVCEVEGRKKLRFETQVVRRSTNPSWNHSHKWDQFPLGKSLQFTVWSKDTIEDEVLGRATLKDKNFNPYGFDGELTLDDVGYGGAASLAIRVYLPPLPSFDVKVGAAVGTGELGVALLLPPGTVFVSSVQSSSWADKNDIKEASEIMSVNGIKAHGMTTDAFVSAMQERPLRLTLQPPSLQAKHMLLNDLRKPFQGFQSEGNAVDRKIKERSLNYVNDGVILACAPPDGDDDADVYAAATSNEIVREITRGHLLMAAGPSVDVAGIMMVPVRPRGAVELECFQIVELVAGTVLVCSPPLGEEDEDVEIYGSMGSFGVLRKVEKGEKLIAAGPAESVNDTVLVPVKPAGAVEIDFFKIGHAIVQDSNLAALAQRTDHKGQPKEEVNINPSKPNLHMNSAREKPQESPLSMVELDNTPASVRSNPGALKPLKLQVKIVGARGLRGADLNGNSDPYCICEVPGRKGLKFKTPVSKKTLNPVWNFEHEFDSFFPTDSLLFKVWDKDLLRDDFLGKVELEPTVFILRGYQGDLVLQDAGKGIHATLQVAIDVVQSFGEGALKPKTKQIGGVREEASNPLSKQRVSVTLIGAQGLADASANSYCVCKVLGRKDLTFKTPVSAGSDAPRWNHKHDLVDISSSDSIQFSVFDHDDAGGDDLLGKVIVAGDKFIPNGFVGTLSLEDGDEGATLSVMLEVMQSVANANSRGNDSHREKSVFRVTIIGANGLASASADTYCVCKVPGRKDLTFKTPVVMDSRDPRWNYQHDLPNLTFNDMLQFSIFDQDDGGDDLLGRAIIEHKMFFPSGFVGTLPLEDGEEDASLSIMVETLNTKAGGQEHSTKVMSNERIGRDQESEGLISNASSPRKSPQGSYAVTSNLSAPSSRNESPRSPQSPHGNFQQKDAFAIKDITKGTILICEPPADDDNRTAEIYESPNSTEVIATLEEGEQIIASGVPVTIDESVMVPVKPRGAVDVTLFRILPSDALESVEHEPAYENFDSQRTKHAQSLERDAASTAAISAGTILICSPPPSFSSSVEVFESPYSQNVIASIQEGEEVVAAGPPEDVNGQMMVRIRPQGAVELIAFRVGDAMSDNESDSLAKSRSSSDVGSDTAINSKIMAGSVLVCFPSSFSYYEDRTTGVFASIDSNELVRELQEGDQVVASGSPVDIAGTMRVTVRPSGAVEVHHFQVSESLTLVVGNEVQSLGMFPIEPPGRVTVESIVPGSWADTVGLSPGDEIVRVNDERAEDMENDYFFTCMQERPLNLVVYPVADPGVRNDDSESDRSSSEGLEF